MAGALTFTVATATISPAVASAEGHYAGPAVITRAVPVRDAVNGAGPEVTVPRLARQVQSPCAVTTARYRAAQHALADGDIDAADDLAILAAALIEQCGWTPVDTALGDRS